MSKNETGLQYAMIKNTSVVESVKDWIIDQLIKGNLRPGSKRSNESVTKVPSARFIYSTP